MKESYINDKVLYLFQKNEPETKKEKMVKLVDSILHRRHKVIIKRLEREACEARILNQVHNEIEQMVEVMRFDLMDRISKIIKKELQ